MEEESDKSTLSAVAPAIVWKEEYLTGHPEIDYQHQYFAQLINRVNQHLFSDCDKTQKDNLLWELVKYAEFHFLSEINIMRELGIEGRERHQRLHNEISASMARSVQLAMSDLISPDAIIKFLVDWFVTHTVVEDKENFSKHGKNL